MFPAQLLLHLQQPPTSPTARKTLLQLKIQQ